jgi:hypothetical protein
MLGREQSAHKEEELIKIQVMLKEPELMLPVMMLFVRPQVGLRVLVALPGEELMEIAEQPQEDVIQIYLLQGQQGGAEMLMKQIWLM